MSELFFDCTYNGKEFGGAYSYFALVAMIVEWMGDDYKAMDGFYIGDDERMDVLDEFNEDTITLFTLANSESTARKKHEAVRAL